MLHSRRMIALAEGKFNPIRAKTVNGAIMYMPEQVVAVIDSEHAGKTVQDVLGHGGDIPVVSSIEEGSKLHPDTLLIGIAPPGGRLPEEWREYIRGALRSGLDVISGLHTFLSDDQEFARLAAERNCRIVDLRKVPAASHVVSKGHWKSRRAKTILTIGTDCNIGKMVTTLEVCKEFMHRGLKSDFVATGQTGILIAGKGVAVDSVVGDYIAGSIEKEIDRSETEGHEYIFVEGQGSLLHQGYSSVTLGLMHGTMPDAMVLCHQPSRKVNDYGTPITDLNRLIRLHEEMIAMFRPTKVVGVGISSVGMNANQSLEESKRIEDLTGLPAVDTFRFGGGVLADALLRYFGTPAES